MAQLNDGRAEILSRDDGKLLSRASAGSSHTVVLNQPSVVKIHGTRAMVTEFERHGNDLTVHMRDGSIVHYRQFFLDDIDGDHSELVFDDGSGVPEHALFPVTNEFAEAQTAVAAAPEYESLSSIEPLLLAGSGASGGVITAAGLGALGLVGVTAGAVAAGGGGGSGSDDDGGNVTAPGTSPVVTLDLFTGDAVLSVAEKSSNQILSGSTQNAPEGSVVTITLNGKTYTTAVGSDGGWRVTLPTADLLALSAGSNTINVSVTTGTGASASASENIVVESAGVVPGSPAIDIDPFAGNDRLEPEEMQASQIVSGTTRNIEQGQRVAINMGEHTYIAVVGADGRWSVTVPVIHLQVLAQGTLAIVASVNSQAGAIVSTSHTIEVVMPPPSLSLDPLSGDGYLNGIEAQLPLTLSGVTSGVPAAAIVSVTLGASTWQATVNADGSWRTTVPAADLQLLPQGANPVTAVVTLADGTVIQNIPGLSLIVSTLPPSAAIDLPFGDGVLNGPETGVAQILVGQTGITGAGQTVTVSLGGVSLSGTVASDGSWQITLPPDLLQALPQGSNEIAIVVTDRAGNSATAVTTVNVATTPPPLSLSLPEEALNRSDVMQPVTLVGQSSGSESVTVTLNGEAYVTRVNPDGSWRIDIPAADLQQMGDGSYPVTVTATDAIGNSVTQTGVLVVDVTPPVVTLADVAGDGYLNAAEHGQPLTLNGSAESGAAIVVTLNNVTYSVTPDANGNWQLTIPADVVSALPDGRYTVSVEASDPAGNVAIATQPLIVATAMPEIRLHSLTSDNLLDGAEKQLSQLLTGTVLNVEAGQQITVTLNGESWSGAVQADGNWSVLIPAEAFSGLANGTQDYTVTVSDAAGNAASASGRFDVDNAFSAIAIGVISDDNTINAVEAQNDLPIAGSSRFVAPGARILVRFNGVDYSTTAGENGEWQITVPASALTGLGNSSMEVTATANDVNGNVVTVTHNLMTLVDPNFALTVDIPFTDGTLNGAEVIAGQTLTGRTGVTGEGQTVSVVLNGVTLQGTVDADGNWRVSLPADLLQALPQGQNPVSVNVTDLAGNAATLTGSVVVDTLAPRLTLETLSDNDRLNLAAQSQTLTLTGSGDPGETIVVMLNGANYIARVAENGDWRIDVPPDALAALTDGRYQVIVTSTDAAGNATSLSRTLEVDLTPPSVTVNEAAGDGYLNSVEGLQPLTIDGTGEAGSAITLEINDGIWRTVVDQNGQWSVTLPADVVSALSDGRYAVNVTASDLAGNRTVVSTSLIVDKTAPVITLHDLAEDNVIDGAERQTEQILSGTADNVEAGQTLSITFNGETWYATVQSGGGWQVTLPASAFATLVDGDYTLSVSVTDRAGNAAAVDKTFSVNDALSAIAWQPLSGDGYLNAAEAQNDLRVEGSSVNVAEGSIVTFTLGGQTYTATVAADGSWSVTVPSEDLQNLAEGPQQASASVNGTAVTHQATLEVHTASVPAPSMQTPFADGTLNGAEAGTVQTLSGSTGIVGDGQTVVVNVGGSDYRATVDSAGNWQLSLTPPVLQALSQGENTLTVTASDVAGNSGSLPVTINVDTLAPQLSLNAIAGDGVINSSEAAGEITVSGGSNAQAGEIVTVLFNGQRFTTAVDEEGGWRLQLPAGLLLDRPDGSYPLTVSLSDAAGNTATVSEVVRLAIVTLQPTLATPFGDGWLNISESGSDQALNGTTGISGPGQTVTVNLAGTDYSATVDASGNWTLPVSVAMMQGLEQGGNPITVTVRDAEGNSGTVSSNVIVDLTAPDLRINEVTGDNVINAAEIARPVSISGTASPEDAGQQITLIFNGQTYQQTVRGDGSWQFDLPAGATQNLADGSYPVSVTLTDRAGNRSEQNLTLNVEASPASMPTLTIDTVSLDDYINRAEAGDDLIVSGSTSAEPGRTVTLTLNGESWLATVEQDGSWRVTVPAASVGALSDGAQTFSAAVSNSVGNPASATHQVTVVAQAANQPTLTINPVTSDDTVNSQEAGSDLEITGGSQRLAPGSAVVVTLNGKAYETTADASGSWQVTVPAADVQALDQGSNTVTASGSDVAGNPATASGTFNVDTRAPVLDVALSAGDTLNMAEALAGLTVSGNTEAGLTVSVTLNGKIWSVSADGDGAWRLIIPAGELLLLADGIARVGVTVSDASGNQTSSPVDLNVAINTLPLLTLTTPFTDGLLNAAEAAAEQILTGQATHLAPGTAVIVTIGGLSFNGVVDEESNWRVTIPAGALSALDDGAFQLAVSAADAAGNPASAAVSVELLVKNSPEASINTPFGDGLLNALEAGETQIISGTTGVPGDGQTVVLLIDGRSFITTVDAQGYWQATLTPAQLAEIGNGTHTLTVTVSDRAGNSDSGSLSFDAIITGLPAPTLATPFTDGVLNAAEAAAGGALSGTTGITGAQTVTITLNGTRYQAEVDSATGNWNFNLPASVLNLLPDGNWPVEVQVTDGVGNAQTANGMLRVDIHSLPDVTINLPFGDGQLNVAEAAAGQILSGNTGKVAPGQTVTVSIDGGTAISAAVNASGDWSLALTPEQLTAPGSGTHQLTVTATDSAGNQDSADLAFNARLSLPVPTIVQPFGDGVLNISEMNNAIVFNGTTGVSGLNQDVQLRIDVDGIIWTGTVNDNGDWVVALPAGALGGLSNGQHSITVTVTDGAGNSNTQSLDFVASLTAPQPTINVPFIDGFLNGTEASAGASLSGNAGTAQRVTVTLNGTAYDAVVNGDGTWTLALSPTVLGGLTQGSQGITVVATDVAGNATTLTGDFTVDTLPPAVTIVSFVGDTLTYVESLTTQLLSGTTTGARAGQVVTVTIGSATLSGVVQADGSWSVNVTPEAMAQLGNSGTGTLTATVSDVAGNIASTSASVTVDLTPPSDPLLTLAPISGDNIVNASDDATLTISGTFANLNAANGAVSGSVTVMVNGEALPESAVVNSENGSWRITLPTASLPEGALTVTATLTTDQGDTLTASEQLLVDRIPPDLTIDAFAGDDRLNGTEAASSQTISGTASVTEVGRPVTLSLNGKSWTAIVQADGSWAVAVPEGDLQALAQGSQTLTATLTDAAGNPASAERTFTVDTAAPLLQVDALLGDNLLNAADIATAQVLTGRAAGAEGQTISLYLGDSSPIATAIVDADGTFRINLTPEVLGSLSDGALVFGLRVSDRAGNQTDATLTVNKVVNSALNLAVDPLFGDGFLNAAEAAVAQTITGLATSAGTGATVSLTLGGTTLSTTVGQDGRYALVVPPDVLALMSNGEFPVNLVLTDAAGNVRTLPSTVTAILNTPVFSALDGLFGGDNRLNIAEAAVAQTIGGTVSAVVGSTVTVTLGGKSWQSQVGAGGNWSVTLLPADLATLASGTLTLGVKVVDPAGNTAASAVNVDVFTAQPAITLGPIFGDGILNIAESKIAQTIAGTVTNVTAGTVVNLTLGSATVQATVGQSGAFTATVSPELLGSLVNGTLTVAASLTDAAGNTARASANATVKVTAPVITLDPLFGDGLLNALDARAGQILSGTITGAEAGARVTVSFGSSQFVTTTAANGAFTLALTPAMLQGLSDGALAVGVSVTDAAGNSNSASATAVVGIHALPVISLNPLFGDGVLNLLESLVTQTISGTVANAAAGSVVTIALGNTTVTATVNQDGTFRAQLAPALLSTLLDGNLTVSASVTDVVGNVASVSTGIQVGIHTAPTLSVNTIFDDGVLSASDLLGVQTISGVTTNVAAGSLVSVALAGKTYTATVSSGGGWSLSVPKADLAVLANGTLTVSASVTDSYGNIATGSNTLNVTAQTPPTVSISTIFGDGLLNAADAQSTQIISGTATQAEGSTLTVRVGASTLTTTVGANGTWSVSVPTTVLAALPDGTDTITAALTNAAGRAASVSGSVLVGTHTLPTVALTASSVFGGDHYLNLSEANAAKTISGTSANAVGSTVSVTLAGNTLTTTVGANGTWSVSLPSATLKAIPDGSYSVTVTLTDAVGNVSTTSDSFTAVTHNLPAIGVDPVLSLVNVLVTGLTVSGGTLNLAQGTRLTITLNGSTQQVITDALGRYSAKFTGGLLSTLSLNSVVTVTAVDAAGNPASTSNTLVVGSLLPAAATSATVLLAVAADDDVTASAHHQALTPAVHDAAAASDTHSSSTVPESSVAPLTPVVEENGYTIGGVTIDVADGQSLTGNAVSGSSGDDTLTLSSLDFSHISGGAGTDTLVLSGDHMALDLTSLGLRVEHIEIIDLGKAGNNSVKLDLNEALNITDTQHDDLVIKGADGNRVTLANGDDGEWTMAGYRTIDGQSFDIYHNSALAATNTLGDVLVQHNLQVHIV
ncbi:Ig-like domain-containing protein [Erwinia sp. 9145]|uniref:Ig-like domain-containing protein n=1 Tax=Erwinia sp. 9145 TaxID=1500895 RepID=UPI00054EDC02|nr:Ig-like domain-containing protein [Erwinia sp. 9145]